VFLLTSRPGGETVAQQPAEPTPSAVRQLEDRRVSESSGLAASGRVAGHFWTHNDSGDSARLFRLLPGAEGLRCEPLQISGATAIDWEDMAAFSWRGQPMLVIGDVGDNAGRREQVALYLLGEPGPGARAAAAERIRFRYADGPRDCEAMVVDGTRGEAVLITKGRVPLAGVYTLSLDEALGRRGGDPARREAEPPEGADEVAVARRVGMLPVPMVTAADLRPDRRQLAVATYLEVFLFDRQPDEPWETTLRRTPRHVALPKLRQIEAIAYDPRGRLWVTSEGRPMPLAAVELREEPASRGDAPR
jgi:hypothetical protein